MKIAIIILWIFISIKLGLKWYRKYSDLKKEKANNWADLKERVEGMRKVVNKYDILLDATEEEIYKDLTDNTD